MFTMSEIIEFAIRIEKNGEKVYRDASEKVSDPSLVSLLQRLADEESEHLRWFSDLKGTVKEERVNSQVGEMGQSLLLEIVGDQTFSLKEWDLSTIVDLKEVLKIALGFEKDTVIFYEMMGSFIQGDAVLAKLDQIIQEENRHIRVLSEFLHK
ncbi:MAG: ferritin family protein [Deltaproteobacteria bacterium]|nr:ferritin family protein [Deltaproteobacteria bacterium]